MKKNKYNKMGCICSKNKNASKISQAESQIQKKKIQNMNDLAEFDLIFGQRAEENFLSVKVELFLSCKGLYKFDRNVKKNVVAVLYSISQENIEENNKNQELVEEGRTEICMDSLNPVFIKTFILNYRFQDESIQQDYLIQIFYIRLINSPDDLSKQIFLGEANFNLRDTINSRNQEKELKISNKKLDKIENLGIIKIRAVEREENYEFLSIKFGIRELISKNPISLKIHVKKNIGDWWPIYLTKQIQQKSKITFWDIAELPINSLYSNIGETKIKFEVIEYLKNERIKILGNLQMNVKDFMKAPPETEITLSRRFKNYLLIQDFNKFNRFKFFDYLISDLNIKLFLFMDFTSSKINKENKEFFKQKSKKYDLNENINKFINKNFVLFSPKKKPRNPNNIITNKSFKMSLEDLEEKDNKKHIKNIDTITLSPIKKIKVLKSQKSMVLNLKKLNTDDLDEIKGNDSIDSSSIDHINSSEISQTLQDLILLNESIIKFFSSFDTDGKFPMFAFGAKLPEAKNTLNNCFSATFDMMNPDVDNLIDTYSNVIEKIEPAGPVIINECMSLYMRYLKAEKITKENQIYSIAIFICTSNIVDMNDFIQNVEESSKYHCSLLIITIGNNIDKNLFERFNTKDFDDFLKHSINEIKFNPVRSNVYYINFEEAKNSRNLKLGSELKPFLKKIFKRVTNEVSEYFSMNQIFPYDYENLKSRSIYNYIQFKNKCKNEPYTIPEYLIKLKNESLLDLFKIGYNLKDIEDSFSKFPTFDKQYIFDIMNTKKQINSLENLNENKENKISKEEFTNLKYIISKNKVQLIQANDDKNLKINDQHNVDKQYDKMKINKLKKPYNEKICNVCKEKKINIIFGDCKHKYLCEECLSDKYIICPICLKRIKKYIKLYRV